MGGFRWLSDRELANFDVVSVLIDSDVSYFVECDLRYPTQIIARRAQRLPTSPEHLHIDDDMLEIAKLVMYELNKRGICVRSLFVLH